MLPPDEQSAEAVIGGSGQSPSARGRPDGPNAVILIRNSDRARAYDLRVDAFRDGEAPVFRRRYYLQPGLVESETDALPSGEYEIRATLDNSYRETRRCRIGSTPAQTAVIEVGNGVLSLTQGAPR